MDIGNTYRKLHSTDLWTWIGHALQALLVALVTFVGMSLIELATSYDFTRDLKFGVGTYAALCVFAHRELSDIIPAWIAAREATSANRAGAQKRLTEKLVDGFGDFWSVPVGVGLFVLIVSLF